MNKKYKFTKENLHSTIKVLLWSVGSSVVAGLLVFISDTEFPKQYALFVPIINTILVAIKEFLDEKK